MVLYTNLASHRPRTWKVTQKPMPVSKQFPYGLAVRIPGFHTGGLGSTPLMGNPCSSLDPSTIFSMISGSLWVILVLLNYSHIDKVRHQKA